MNTTPNFKEIREAILRDIRSLNPKAHIDSDSDNFIRASSLASCAVGQYAHQAWILRQFFPDTADSEYLERHCHLRGIQRKKPTYAIGKAFLKGLDGSIIPEGTQILLADRFYQTRNEVSIDESGQVEVNIIASEAGRRYNAENMDAKLMAAPSGVATELTIKHATGGTDAENDQELLARLLELLRRPPAGGNRYDFKNWALSIDGVSSAYVYPLRRGLGTVDIAITSGGNVPSDEIIQKVQNFIDEVRPVTAKNSNVIKPDVTNINIQVAIKTIETDRAKLSRDVEKALTDYFNSIQPGDGIVVSQIETIISRLDGVIDRRLIHPTTNMEADLIKKIEWFQLGTIQIESLK